MDFDQILQSAADGALYGSIRNYIAARIELLLEYTLSRNLSLALTMIGALFTLWIMVQGYLILTGRSQENLKAFIFNLGKTYIIILVALGVSSTSEFSLRTLTEVTTDGIASLMTGDSDVSECTLKSTSSLMGCKIDKSLTVAQASMAFINQIDTADNPDVAAQVERAKLFAGAGAAGPGIVTGTMLIIYRVAMALFVGFAPFFILCLMFKKTTPYFSKWLNYGLATMFSSALLAAMASISTDLVKIIAQSQYKYSKIASITGIITGESVTGIFNSAMNQLGLGLMLSTVLIIVPPMAGSWFNGMMSGAYYGANQFERWNNPNGGVAPIGSGAGSGAHGMPAYGNQQQSVNYQSISSQNTGSSPNNSASIQNITRDIATNASQTSNPITPPGLAVGVGKQAQQSNPNGNNGGNGNDQA
ncbi:type IV secretion system protein [Kingella oralis]|uniref:type IV secretion system protein n=1 Tax=Kingella oralis TaxID=505 RepID=UPI0034E54CC5